MIILIAVGMVACSQKQDKDGKTTSAPSKNLLQYLVGDRSEHPKGENRDASLPLVKVEISPEHPTVLDSLRAVIRPLNEVPAGSYIYEWRVDDRIVESVTGPLLSNEFYKKHNIIKVNVCTIIDEKKYLCGEGNTVIIANSAPSLEMNLLSSRTKEFADMQLIGNDPDGDKLIYAIESPVPDGMTVDASSGKLRWKVPAGFRGTLKFDASATDSDGAKVIKTFEVSVSSKP